MTSSRIALVGPVLCLNLVMLQSLAVTCRAGSFDQDEDASSKPKVLIPGGVGSSLLSINEDYARQLLQLERQRLVRLGQLAARQAPNEAAVTYEQLFRSAIANNLFREAEPAAQQVLKSASAPINQFLARTIDIIASADRGAYDESLSELRRNRVSLETDATGDGRARHVRIAGAVRSLLPASTAGRPA